MKAIQRWSCIAVLAAMLLPFSLVFAQAAAPAASPVPAIASAPAVAAPAADLPLGDLLSQIMEAVKGFGGMAWGMKIAVLIGLLIASMKVSIIRPYTWDKVPASLKVWLAPFLAMVAGVAAYGKFDKASLIAFMLAGGGAVLLDQVLEGVKQIPGLGPQYVSAIEFMSKLLKKPTA
jgi:hypothetical protein